LQIFNTISQLLSKPYEKPIIIQILVFNLDGEVGAG